MIVDITTTASPCTTVSGVMKTVVVLGIVGTVIVNMTGAETDDL